MRAQRNSPSTVFAKIRVNELNVIFLPIFAKIRAFILILFFLGMVNDVYANIIMKVMAANPSKDQNQVVPIKVYLPKETKPEDVVDKGDLEVSYDTQQGSYFIYKDYDLKPGEVVERTIELKDIWVIPESELEFLRLEAEKISATLKNTEFVERVSFLTNSIGSKLNLVGESQRNSPANPERHISDYRDNLKIVEAVKADIALLRSLLSQAKPFPAMMVWKVIIAIIVFLAILGVAFYIIWHRQMKVISSDETFFVPKEGSAGQIKSAEESPQDKEEDK